LFNALSISGPPFGGIDLDPCAAKNNPLWIPAHRHFTEEDNGLELPWVRPEKEAEGLPTYAYVNNPYGHAYNKTWANKVVKEYMLHGTHIINLVENRPGSAWYRWLNTHASVKAEIQGRLKFNDGKESAKCPSVLFYFGPEAQRFSRHFSEEIRDPQDPSNKLVADCMVSVRRWHPDWLEAS
jgi:hypothetical protein